jgi:predicted nucleic acid-binding protein
MMVMPVTDDQAAALRALLRDDMDSYRRLFDALHRAEARKGYTALVTGAFIEAVERRFGAAYQPADIVTFVASIRARSDRLAAELDPEVAERVIRVVLEDAPVDDLSRNAVTGAQMLLLGGLIADAHLDDAGLDEFLAAARKLADQLMS